MELTTENPLSSYGVPVLVIDGKAFGALDRLPSGEVAFHVVKANAKALGEQAADKFMRSAPDLYFD